jgi:hypothetical protein
VEEEEWRAIKQVQGQEEIVSALDAVQKLLIREECLVLLLNVHSVEQR